MVILILSLKIVFFVAEIESKIAYFSIFPDFSTFDI